MKKKSQNCPKKFVDFEVQPSNENLDFLVEDQNNINDNTFDDPKPLCVTENESDKKDIEIKQKINKKVKDNTKSELEERVEKSKNTKLVPLKMRLHL